MIIRLGDRSETFPDRNIHGGTAFPARQHAILILSHRRHRVGQPVADQGQNGDECEGDDVDGHAVAVIVRRFVPCVFGEVLDGTWVLAQRLAFVRPLWRGGAVWPAKAEDLSAGVRS